MDAQTALVNGKLQEVVFTKQAPGVKKTDKTNRPFVINLRKSLYGLQQSPSVWNSTIDKELRTMGMASTTSDRCVYTTGSGNHYIMLTLFVDDLIITGPSTANVAEARSMRMAKIDMTEFGDVTQILGVDVKRDKEAGTIELNRGRYALSVVERFNVTDCIPTHTPGTGKELKLQPE
ncbi:unnamed protein product [Laminaria digitata]